MVSNYFYPSQILFGEGTLSKSLDRLPKSSNHIFIISGRNSMRKAGILDEIKSIAKKKGLACTFSSSVFSNPKDTDIDKISLEREKSGADIILGIGGGSSMDAAKIISFMATNKGNSWDYVNMPNRPAQKIKGERLPLVLIPTTSGTASESTPYAVLTKADTKMKKGIGSIKLYPDVVVIDNNILNLMNKKLVAITGFDAFGQALEGYTSKNSTFHSEYFGFSALRTIIENLFDSWSYSSKKDPKLNMAWGTLLSGLSIGIVDVNLAHAMSHPLSAYYNMQHGLAVLLCTFQSIRFNQTYLEKKYSNVAKLMGYKKGGVDEMIEKLYDWVKSFDIDINLKNYGVNESDFDIFAEDALQIGAINTNIRKINKRELVTLYRKIYNGIID